ncbi:unnamed protein product [Ostreobium quekettii]|uniref:Cation efflux protein transmembrane domain-containing protein n=1 Tax=Ostreobium quekettii TaxID=121088 RepID=A0A8S1IQA4_9CHLO|nr:unnamed protein product [Ostreobium quekettii]|eukprot:evm.model.scf_1826.3 EVM.evm.TU.scf_1826.3   scf_1826:12102-21345(+)
MHHVLFALLRCGTRKLLTRGPTAPVALSPGWTHLPAPRSDARVLASALESPMPPLAFMFSSGVRGVASSCRDPHRLRVRIRRRQLVSEAPGGACGATGGSFWRWHALAVRRNDCHGSRTRRWKPRDTLSSSASASAAGVPLTADDNNGATTSPRYMLRDERDQEFLKRELHTINVAVGVNFAIFLFKLGASAASGSSSMLAEAVHSLADVGNQVLLRTGVLQGLKGPTPDYPYGYSRDKFVWSLISAVGIFFAGAGVSLVHGLQGLFMTRQLDNLSVVYWVLGGSFVLEGYSFLVALRAVTQGAAQRGMRVLDYVLLGRDPTPIAVLLEDSGAVVGLMVAGLCTALSSYTGSTMWDSLGSIFVGILMGGVATFLIRMNRSFLIGRSMNKREMQLIMRQLRNDPVVKNVYDYKSEEIGPGKYRFKAEIDFNGEVVVDNHLKRTDREEVFSQLRAATWAQDDRALDFVVKQYGKELVSAVGAEVDRLEADILRVVPGVVHVDLEVDRGKVDFLRKRFPRVPTDPKQAARKMPPHTAAVKDGS